MPILYTLWSILNVILFIAVVIYARALLTRYRFVSISLSIAFMALLVYLFSGRNASARKSAIQFQTAFLLPDLAHSKSYHAELDDLPTLNIHQIVTLTPDTQSDSAQVSSSSYLTGFVSGYQWSPISIVVGALPDRRLHYSTSGVLAWKLLGLTVYRQPKQFDGWLTR